MEHYRKCFNRLLENPEDEVLVITGSSKLSGCYQSACIAREACHDPARVTVLDSLNATCAEYMLVDQALRYRREGVSDMPTMLAKLRDVMAHYKSSAWRLTSNISSWADAFRLWWASWATA